MYLSQIYIFFKPRLLISLLAILCRDLGGQPIPVPAGLRSIGLGGVSVGLTDGFAVFNNPSLMPLAGYSSLSLAVQNRFLVPDLNIFQGAAQLALDRNQSIGVGLATQGIDGFLENHLTVGYGLSLSSTFSIGVRLNLTHYQLAERGSVFLPHTDFGARYQVRKSFSISMMYYNPLQVSRIKEYEDYFPTGVGLGFSHDISSNLLLLAEFSKLELSPVQYRFGIEWHWMNRLWIRSGYSHTNSAFSLGIGFEWKSLISNISFMHMAIPGGLSGADFTYRW